VTISNLGAWLSWQAIDILIIIVNHELHRHPPWALPVIGSRKHKSTYTKLNYVKILSSRAMQPCEVGRRVSTWQWRSSDSKWSYPLSKPPLLDHAHEGRLCIPFLYCPRLFVCIVLNIHMPDLLPSSRILNPIVLQRSLKKRCSRHPPGSGLSPCRSRHRSRKSESLLQNSRHSNGTLVAKDFSSPTL
jgi:hypothetical protein